MLGFCTVWYGCVMCFKAMFARDSGRFLITSQTPGACHHHMHE